uniref:Pleckstrin homology domain-containing family G member 1 n=1 Tax=Pyxicephalus adspersus TaxID=30357 RepID=A0AAV3AVW0_PYXAD|nr:TPA: hypothetical protein GDO54_011049 [Pyxicephalus adspersus]
MELSDSDRPVSFGSTSSSASSRDSHCSFGSRMTLASNSHLGLFHPDKEAGAIKLELVPSRLLSSDDLQINCDREQAHESPKEQSDERRTMSWKESKGGVKNFSKSEGIEPTSPKLMYVDRVVQEILQTERTYVQDLKSIVEDYLNCICDQRRLSLGTEERSALFGNIRDIYHFNSELLKDLENCDNDPVAIAECFVSKSEEFHIYTQYCTNYPRSVAVLTECMRNKILAKFFRERQEVLQHCLPLGSYLLKPVQRILKYHLLLHEISNHLDKDTEGYDVVLDAIDTMQRVAWHINDMKRKHEHDIRLQEIQSLLTNWKGPDLTSYGELVLEGTFRFQRAKNERTLFLFDRLLLITKKRDDTYTYKAHILCCNLMLVEVIPKEPLSFSVFHYKSPKLQHTVQAKSQQEKRLWILHLKRLILENHPAKIPAKAKQAILEMDAIHHPGFSYSAEGEKKPTANLKEDAISSRVRRKSGKKQLYLFILESSKDQSDEETLQMSTNHRFSASPLPTNIEQGISQTNSLIMNILGGTGGLQNIWTDHQIRQALFPSRRSPQVSEENDDDYQMFLMNECSKLESSRSQEERGATSRPCSWHLGLMQEDSASNSFCKVVRRASSVGENKTHSRHSRSRQNNRKYHCEVSKNYEQDPKFSSFGSSEELTIDDIEHVYDNISYDDLKQMGLRRRDDSEFLLINSVSDSLHHRNDNINVQSLKEVERNKTSPVPNKEKVMPKRGPSKSSSQELKIIEENIYDSICISKQSMEQNRKKQHSKRSSFLGLDGEFQCFDAMDHFASEDSLQFSEDESSDHRVPAGDEYFNQFKTSPKVDSIAQKNAADRLSEEVDKIWNDLENYIKKNEEKKNEHLLASFPVSKEDVHEKRHVQNRPRYSKEYSQSSLCLLDKSPLPRAVVSRSPSVHKEDPSPPASPSSSVISLKRTSLTSEMSFMESPYFSSQSTLNISDKMGSALGLDSAEKSKNKVFTMAREYSQKIRKANHLLKMKSPEQEQPSCRSQKLKEKDLAAIMEEKKQGGTAIGARIAEYSQLYDQILFRDSPARAKKESRNGAHYSPSVKSQEQLSPQPSIKCSPTSNRHTANINGATGDFLTWSDFKDVKTKSEVLASGPIGKQSNLAATCSVLSLNKSNPSSLHTQRWSTFSQRNDEKTSQDHGYNSLGRRVVYENARPYIRSQSSSSMLLHRTKEPIKHGKHSTMPQSRHDSKPERMSEIYDFGGSSFEEKGPPEENSDMTLQDSQKILVLNKLSSLNAQIATLNYLANFKDNEGDGDDDDDDYVEIKSDDDEDGLEASSNQPVKLNIQDQHSQSPFSSTPYSFSMPSTPVKTMSDKESLDTHITGYEDVDKLKDYLWRPPSTNQQNIVQSLREKFQCLSSSSFA